MTTDPTSYPRPSKYIDSLRATIDQVIRTDEGGWILSKDPDGGDGGWTYAGVTCKTYTAWKKSPEPISLEDMREKLGVYYYTVQFEILRIYKEIYYLPALEIIKDEYQNTISVLSAAELSCVVNCGLEGFKEVLARCKLTGSFLVAWRVHYYAIVKADPKKAIYLKGWMARVDRYRAHFVPNN